MEPAFLKFKDHEGYEVFLNLNAITGMVIKEVPSNHDKYIIAWNILGGFADKATVYKNTMEKIREVMTEYSFV